jgi:hypothetical protein
VQSSRPTTLVCVAVLILAWGTYWIAFFPGIVSHDVTVQWSEIQSRRYDDLHPAFHTFLLWLVTRFYPSLGAVSGLHVVLTAALAGHLLGTARRLGAPQWLIGLALLWMIGSPVFPMNVIAVGRDSAFAIALLWTTALVARSVDRHEVTVADGLVLGVALAVVSLLRHNGAAIALALLCVIAWCHDCCSRRGVAVAGLTCVVAVAVVRGPVYHAVGVAPMPPVVSQGYVIHQVAALMHARTKMTDDEAAFVSKLAPLAVWRSAYDCADSYPILYRAGLDVRPLLDSPLRLVRIWAALAARNPGALLAHWRCVTAFIRRHDSPVRIGPLPSDGMLAPADAVSTIRQGLSRLVAATTRPRSVLHLLVWQPALVLDVLLGSVAVALWRSRSRLPVLVWTPALANTLVWLAGIAPSPHLRYQWPAFLLAPVLVTFSSIAWRPADERAAGDQSNYPKTV